MKKLLLLLACLLIVTNASSATAKGPAGRLDPSFGTKGKTMIAFPAQSSGKVGVKYEVPFQFTAGHIEMAAAPGGKLVVAGSTRVARLLPNGKLDPSFGSGDGWIAMPPLPGRSFVLASVAVDSRGRVVVAGSTRPLPTSTTLDPLLSSVGVMRFNADGSLDSSFGAQGVLVTDLGIEPPSVPTGNYIGASVGVRSLAVDSQNRILLTGGAIVKASLCGPNGSLSAAYVARLAETGNLDPTFGSGGLRQIADLASLGQAGLTPSGALFTVGAGNPRCGEEGGGPSVVLASFASDGAFDPSFGFSGFRSIGYPKVPVATVAPSGKIVLLGTKQNREQVVTRLLPNGTPDPSFGRIGRVRIIGPKSASIAAVAVDDQGRLLFAGRVSRRVSKSPKNTLRRSTFILARMNPNGNFDRSFGRHGSVRTGFGGPASSFATEVMVDKRGRIVVGGGVTTPRLSTGGGFAIARYLSGR
jgi:uncharacterized delta-60 repeat protein